MRIPPPTRRWLVLASAGLAMLAACGRDAPPPAVPAAPAAATAAAYDPLRVSREHRALARPYNREAPVPAQCYTKTGGVSNPCWTCHTSANGNNVLGDVALQEQYAFSELAKDNRWKNLFTDRGAQIAAIGDHAALRYVRQDNYGPLREALRGAGKYLGWRPDLDIHRGFDEEGFARDGSWWRAFRYKPFPGTFWASNGATDDVMIRLPPDYYTDAQGRLSRELYKINLAIAEAALTVSDTVEDAQLEREVEPVSEDVAGLDLDSDGKVGGMVTRLRGLPREYVLPRPRDWLLPEFRRVRRWQYPIGTEFLHSVRYIDPDAKDLIARRMKELRYSIKQRVFEPHAIRQAYRIEALEKEAGELPQFAGHSETGLANDLGWKLQGFIEDAEGRLRLQTDEETYFCMGCHTNIGVTADGSFSLPRKRPGKAGWGYQSLSGIQDVPQAGHRQPETLTYFERVGGGDEFRANDEILRRFFPDGKLDRSSVVRAAKGGDRDLAWLVNPSRERALLLNKAYMVLVREQAFDKGRDTVIVPPQNVHRHIDNGDTGLKAKKAVYRDGRIWLDW